jgi:hypothetical protein
MVMSITTLKSSAAIASRIRGESGSEWTGLLLSMIAARNRSGSPVSTASGIAAAGNMPPITRSPLPGVRRLDSRERPTRPPGENCVWRFVQPGRAKFPVSAHRSFSR